jgi:hypothetical protein
MRRGLASLNNYVLVVQTTGYSSASPDQTLNRIETQHSQDQDAQVTHVTMTIPVDEEEPLRPTPIRITLATTSARAAMWMAGSTRPTHSKKKKCKIFSQMVDLLPIIDDPIYVGAETMNGIATNHFTFQVSGVGGESGVDVVINQGEYWLAQDGQYLVRYTLLIETLDANTQETIHAEYLIDLTNINQPLSIAFPQGCLDAKNNP